MTNYAAPLADTTDETDLVVLPICTPEETQQRSTIPSVTQATPTRFGSLRTVTANWRELARGDTVVLISRGGRVSGTVDAIAKDGSIVWLRQDGCAGRRMFHKSDGYKTLVDPRST